MVESLSPVASVGTGREKIAGKVGFKVIASLIALNRINHLQFTVFIQTHKKCTNLSFTYHAIKFKLALKQLMVIAHW
jgi:hypothetical protein